MWFIGVEVEQETSAPPPKKNPESAPEVILFHCLYKDGAYLSKSRQQNSPYFCIFKSA